MLLRLYYLLRNLTCPYAAVEAHIPSEGDVVDFGCGYGAFADRLRRHAAGRRVLGLDVDARKIAAAREVFPETRFEVQDDAAPLPEADAIVMVDVLYMLAPPRQRALLAACSRALRPGGVLLVKTVHDRPWWKVLWYRLQDALLNRLLHPTAQTSPMPVAVLHDWLADLGFHVEHGPIDGGYPYPHYLLIARR